MIHFSKNVLFGIAILIFASNNTFGESAKNAPNNGDSTSKVKEDRTAIDSIKSESSNSISVITVYLKDGSSDKVKKFNAEVIGGAVQINLGNLSYDNSKKFIDLESPHLSKMAFYENSKKELITRIFTTIEPEAVRKALDFGKFEDRIVFTLDHQLIGQFKTKTSKQSIVQKLKNDITLSDKNNGKKLDQEQNEKSSEGTPIRLIKTNSPDVLIHNSTKKLGILSAIMVFLFLLFLMIKPLIRKHKRRLALDQKDPLINLGTLNLAPKQQVSLVQVGTEKLLLAVGPSGISLLKDMEKPEPAKQNLRQIAKTNPNPIRLSGESQKTNSQAPRQLNPYKSNAPKLHSASTKVDQKAKSNTSNKQRIAKVDFATTLTNSQETESQIEPAVKAKNPLPRKKPTPAKTSSAKPESAERNQKEPETIEDITKLLREKLKNLPNMDG